MSYYSIGSSDVEAEALLPTAQTPVNNAVSEENTVKEILPRSFRKGRPLHPEELDYVKKIFGDSIDYGKVRITRDHWFSSGSTRVIGNTIHFTSDYGDDFHFLDNPRQDLSREGYATLAHEMAHVWQYQNGGFAYAPEALIKQAAAAYATGSRNTAYDWRIAYDWDLPWESWGPEQQATAIEDWNKAFYAGDDETMRILAPYMEKVRAGEGAPQYSPVGIALFSLVGAGLGYWANKESGAAIGAGLGVLAMLPWNKWLKK